VQYDINYDLEPSYDFAYFEYAGADNVWHTAHTFNGTGFAYPITDVIPGANYTGPLRLRFRIKTDGYGSDEDGFYPSSGAAEFDRVVVSQGATVYCNETFEAEANQAFSTVDGIWSAAAPPPAGDYAGVFDGSSVLQEDIAYTDNTKLRGFFNGSPNNYACGGHPAQLVCRLVRVAENLPVRAQRDPVPGRLDCSLPRNRTHRARLRLLRRLAARQPGVHLLRRALEGERQLEEVEIQQRGVLQPDQVLADVRKEPSPPD
jgi:hypothetical protein